MPIRVSPLSRVGEYTPKFDWGNTTFCQCGDGGISLRESSMYITAYFEAFPEVPIKTFIRGEGKTIEDAEKDAWEKYERIKLCPEHEFERKGYTNGAGFCKHCNLFAPHQFEEIEDEI